MKRTAIVLAFLLTGVASAASAQCSLGGNCLGDAKAWNNMFGSTPAQRAEQANARRAAEVVILGQRDVNDAALLEGMPNYERIKLTHSVEDTLTRLSGAPSVVLRATVLARGGGYLFCGSAIYGQKGSGIFIFDTREGGYAKLDASSTDFEAAGCNLSATILR